MEIELEKNRCIAAGNCVMHSPEVFDQDDEGGIVVLLDEDPPVELRQSVVDAAASCPARAILLHDIDEMG